MWIWLAAREVTEEWCGSAEFRDGERIQRLYYSVLLIIKTCKKHIITLDMLCYSFISLSSPFSFLNDGFRVIFHPKFHFFIFFLSLF